MTKLGRLFFVLRLNLFLYLFIVICFTLLCTKFFQGNTIFKQRALGHTEINLLYKKSRTDDSGGFLKKRNNL